MTAPTISEAAAALGRKGRGKPKTITPERLAQLREHMKRVNEALAVKRKAKQ